MTANYFVLEKNNSNSNKRGDFKSYIFWLFLSVKYWITESKSISSARWYSSESIARLLSFLSLTHCWPNVQFLINFSLENNHSQLATLMARVINARRSTTILVINHRIYSVKVEWEEEIAQLILHAKTLIDMEKSRKRHKESNRQYSNR